MLNQKTFYWMTLVADHSMTLLSRGIQRQGLLALFLSMFVLLSSCQRTEQIFLLSGQTMGTTWSVKMVGMPAGANLPQLQQDLKLLLESINRQMSTYQSDSEISQFNQSDAGWVEVSPDLVAVTEMALSLAAKTEGAYDPTVGPLVNLWGFGPAAMSLTVPEANRITELMSEVGYQRLQVERDSGRIYQPGNSYLDLSSIAKGFAVDKMAAYLTLRGQQNFLVEIGGELRASGAKPDNQPWRIAIEQPMAGIRDVATIVDLENIAVATSGDYRNFFEDQGRQWTHIIDPRTGYPVTHQTGSVTVLHDTCAWADAWATAFMVLGPNEGLKIAEQQQLAVLFLVREGDQVVEYSSSAYQAFMSRAQTMNTTGEAL